ncbi:UDP-N-acetylmuramoyl-L-alanine--D-glutamate ligase, partial [Saccharothrix sp. MB29]|nr:UDP-N-acetylmuramoyl-L-alanine--D-glutamate ligase [Saccharothrix sp. MB29]
AEAVAAGLRSFRPGAHRAVVVASAGGVLYVNDSKATNPHAAAASLRSHPSVVWVAGGLLKGASVDDLVRAEAHRMRGAVLIGADREVIAKALARHAPAVPVAVLDGATMDDAVRAARSMAQPGDAVVLAPAAASMDMFSDYAHRGQAFTEAVQALVTS